jgi:asparagine synthase (glutamine-hydrolysing)
MCGIGGIVRYSPGADQPRLERMQLLLRHRGPDGQGMWMSPHAGLVHTRLALVDPADGAQPLHSDRYLLVYNGEVYNAAELRRELGVSWEFRTRCDAEVVLAAYARWGSACPARLNGMFAFFVWDPVEESGFAARDLLGVKPFVYAYAGGELVFASEAKAVLAALPWRPRARREALLEYLVVPCFSGVETPMFEGLEYLPPGHAMRVDRRGVSITRWGEYDLHGATDDVTPEELRAAVARAVQRTLIADAPVGVFLSGGLDSTAIAACAGRALPTWTVQFSGHDRYDYAGSRMVISDDAPFAAIAARQFGLVPTIVEVERGGIAADLEVLATHNDALPAWEQEVAQRHLARAAAGSCKAVLVGDAADETHYGYHFLLDPDATRDPRGVIVRFAAAELWPDAIDYFAAKYRALAEAAGHDWRSPHARLLATTWLIVHRWLPRLLHNGDIHGMAHGLEARVPFADVELLGLARRLGPALALAGSVEKAALREAMRGVVPESIRLRRKSALPKDQGVEALYQREAARTVADGGLDAIVDRGHILALCARPLDERERALLFRVICLGHWTRAYGVLL